MSAVWFLCVLGTGRAINTSGRALTHHAVPVLVTTGCAAALGAFIWLAVRLTRDCVSAARAPRPEPATVTLDCTQPIAVAPDLNPEWFSIELQHRQYTRDLAALEAAADAMGGTS